MKKAYVLSSIWLMIITVVSCIISFGKESVVASYFGISAEADAYNMAAQVPMILFAVFSVSIQTIIVPLYSKKIYSGATKEEIDKAASNIYNAVMIIAIILVIIGLIGANVIIGVFAPGLDGETRRIAVRLLRIIIPTIFVSSTFDVISGISHVNCAYVAPELIAICRTIVQIAFVIVGTRFWGIYSVAIGLLAGSALQFILSNFLFGKFVNYTPYIKLNEPEIIEGGKQAIPIIAGLCVTELNETIDKAISSFLVIGSISALSYASKITSTLSVMFVQSIAVVMYPIFAEKVAKNDDKAVNDNYNLNLVLNFAILLPMVIGIIFYREEVVTIIFARGSFDQQAVEQTAIVFGYYAVSILFHALRTTSSKVLYAHGDTKSPMVNTAIGAIINIILNLTLVHSLGAVGLALATSLSSICITGMMMYTLKKKYGYISYAFFNKEGLKIILSSFMMSIVLVLSNRLASEWGMGPRLFVGVLCSIFSYALSLCMFKFSLVDRLLIVIKEKRN